MCVCYYYYLHSLSLSSSSLDQFLMLFLIQLSSQLLPAPAAVAVVTTSSSPTRFVPFSVVMVTVSAHPQIDVVFEKRLYTSCSDTKSGPAHSSPDHAHSMIDLSTGIMEAKKILNTLHKELSDGGYNEIYVDQVTEEIVAVTRHCPAHHKSYILMAHTAFRRPPDWATPTSTRPHTGYSDVPPLTIQGTIKVGVVNGCGFEIAFIGNIC